MTNKIYTHDRGIFYEYRTIVTTFYNKYDDNNKWKIKEYWTVFIKFDPKLFQCAKWFYDGHVVDSVTILGISFGKSYSYDSRPLEKWEDE